MGDRSRTAATLGLILVGAAILRVLFFTGYHGWDDVFYIRRAYDLSLGRFDPPTQHFAARLGLVLPTALAYRLFGVSPVTTVAFPYLCSLGSVLAAAACGRRLYGPRAGLVAALLVAMFPMDVLFASMLFSTAPVVLFAGVGLCLFVLAERERRASLHFAGGACLGIAGLVHEATLVVLVFYPVYLAVVRRPDRRHLLAALGLALALSIDPLVHGLMGAPAARLDVLAHAGTALGTNADVDYRGFTFWWIAEPLFRLFSERTFALYSFVVVPVVAVRLVRPARGEIDRALALIVVVGFLWISYGTVSPRAYAPLFRLPRYLAPIVMPALVLVGAELAERFSARARAWVLGLLGASSIACLCLDSGSALRPYQELRTVLAGARPAVVAVEPGARFPLLFAEGFAPAYRVVALGDPTPPGALAVVSTSEGARRVDGGVLIARIEPPETLYLRLLRSPTVARVLAFIRPAERLAEYAERNGVWDLRVYRLSGK